MVNLITENMDIWTAAEIPKTNGGRGRGKNGNGQSTYGIKKLRELILELAVRGKLLAQDPNDWNLQAMLLENMFRRKNTVDKMKEKSKNKSHCRKLVKLKRRLNGY